MISLYCPCCGQHWEVLGALGQWIASCELCGCDADICWSHEKCEAAVTNQCAHEEHANREAYELEHR